MKTAMHKKLVRKCPGVRHLVLPYISMGPSTWYTAVPWMSEWMNEPCAPTPVHLLTAPPGGLHSWSSFGRADWLPAELSVNTGWIPSLGPAFSIPLGHLMLHRLSGGRGNIWRRLESGISRSFSMWQKRKYTIWTAHIDDGCRISPRRLRQLRVFSGMALDELKS